jgi:tryptophanyl-tRNA synthetase
MYTDPNRIRADIPGKVEGNPVFMYHDAFNPNVDEVNDLKERYRLGKVGDVEVKKKLTLAINNFLDPIRERRAQLERNPRIVEEVLIAGSARARAESDETLRMVKEAMGLNFVS